MPVIRVAYGEFDTWRPGYGLAEVAVYGAGTTTLADLFTDEALSVAADNPQTLLQLTIGDISYGRFSAPLYTAQPHYLVINSIDQTGVYRPALTTLAGADASAALVTPTDGTEASTLADIARRRVDVRDYGDFIAVGEDGASASTNNATIVAAIGVAGSDGGGFVEMPPGTYQFTSFTLAEGVVIRGIGRAGTVLQSTQAGQVAIIGGSRAGFSRLTLDGVTLVANSIGIYAANKDQIVIDDVEIKRFETGIQRKGGAQSQWFGLYISNCTNGYRGYGDLAIDAGEALRFNSWEGGLVELCSGLGIDLRYIDAACEHNEFKNVLLQDNTNKAFLVVGGRKILIEQCRFNDNANNLTIEDAAPLTALNSIAGLDVVGCQLSGGTITLTGTLQDVAFRRCNFDQVTVTLTTPSNNVLVEDCVETDIGLEGETTAWIRHNSGDHGFSELTNTSASPVKAWAISLDAGEQVYLEGKVIGRQRNGNHTGFYHVAVSAGRPGASLAYDSQSANFTTGLIVTGATSTATARIQVDTDGGSTGTLILIDIDGVFVDNEVLTDSSSGRAVANGALSYADAALIGTVAALRAAQETNSAWNATFVANGPQIELRVTGDTSDTVEWTVDVDVVSTHKQP